MQKNSLKVRLGALFASLWIRSLRIRLSTPDGFGPGILGVWHRDLLACAAAFKNWGVHTLISQSKDGDFFCSHRKTARLPGDAGVRHPRFQQRAARTQGAFAGAIRRHGARRSARPRRRNKARILMAFKAERAPPVDCFGKIRGAPYAKNMG